MNDIEKIKTFVFDKVNYFANEMIKSNRQNKSYPFSVLQLKSGEAQNKIEEDGYGDWPAVYVFFDTKNNVNYTGKAYGWVWRRLYDHVEKNPKTKDNWKIIIIFGKLWICTHEWIEAQLHEKFPNPKHW